MALTDLNVIGGLDSQFNQNADFRDKDLNLGNENEADNLNDLINQKDVQEVMQSMIQEMPVEEEKEQSDNSLGPNYPTDNNPYIEMHDDKDAQSVSSYVGSDLTPDEEMRKKKVLLFKLKRFQKKGYTLSRPYTMESELIDIQAEVESIKREANLSASVETLKKGLMVSAYLIEMLNTKFDPINAKLENWSNQVKDDIENGDYDEVFEELYDKYTDSLDMPPEMKLISMLGTSALQYHIAQVIVAKTLTDNNVNEVLHKNPQIKRDIMNAVNQSNVGKAQQKIMKEPSNIDGILAELDIEDENAKNKNSEILNVDF